MNQTAPPGDTPPPVPSASEFKDRHTGLLVFGILEILLGVFCVLLAGLMVLGQMMASRTTGAAANARMMIPGMVFYLALAGAFIWLGIGSIRCRRWARALLLILAWSWFCTGVITVPLLAFLMPRILAGSSAQGQGMPQGVLVAIIVFQLVFMTLVMVVIPGVLILFYRSPHVKATCEARDPVRRWTDTCPLPVLAVVCGLWFGAVTILSLPLAYGGVLPVFGTIVSGLPGTLLAVGLAGLWLWLGRLWYQLKVAGWWALLGLLIIFGISNYITFSHVEVMKLYQKMGYPEEQLELIRRQGWISSQFMLWNSVLWLVPILGYLVWVKGFFRPERNQPSIS